MATARYLQITFSFIAGTPSADKLEKVFNNALDWYKYAPNCWIVWTTSDPKKWYERLKPLIDEKDSLFIVAIDINERQGWMTPSFWKWLKKDR